MGDERGTTPSIGADLNRRKEEKGESPPSDRVIVSRVTVGDEVFIRALAIADGRAVVQAGWQPCPRPFSLPDDAPFFVKNSAGFLAAATHVDSDGAAHYDTAEHNYNYQCSDVTHWLPPPPAAAGAPSKDLGESKKNQKRAGPESGGRSGDRDES